MLLRALKRIAKVFVSYWCNPNEIRQQLTRLVFKEYKTEYNMHSQLSWDEHLLDVEGVGSSNLSECTKICLVSLTGEHDPYKIEAAARLRHRVPLVHYKGEN